MRVRFKYFRGVFATWNQLFTEAAAFASEVGPDRLINVSHGNSGGDGSVTVWYWADDEGDDSAA